MAFKLLCKERLENSSHKGLNEEKLGKECEGEIEANEFEPICKKSENIEACAVIVIKECCDKAHNGAHNCHRRADNCGFEKHGVSCAGVKIHTSELERKGGTQKIFQSVSKHEFNENYRPNRHGCSENGDSTHFVDCGENSSLPRQLHKHTAVNDVKAVKNIGVNGNYHCDKGKNHSLKLILRHKKTP